MAFGYNFIGALTVAGSRPLLFDGLQLHLQDFGPFARQDIFALIGVVLHHLRDSFLVGEIADDTGHFKIPGKS